MRASRTLAALVILGAAISAQARGEVLYREIFPSGLEANTPPDTVGWTVHHDATGELYDGSSTGGGIGEWNCSSAAAPGNPIDLSAVNSNPHLQDTEVGYFFFNKDGDSEIRNVLVWTDEVSVANVAKAGLTEVSFYEGNNDNTEMRIALKIADGWYASQEVFIANASPMGSGVKQSISDFSTAAWHPVTLNPGTELSRSEDLVFLPEGAVQAAGIYTDDMVNNYTSHRFDTYEIQGEASGNGLDGDLNDDGFVGGDDLDIVRSFWGQNVTAGDLELGDPSGDGFVGGDDLDIVRANWGQGTPPVPTGVPEPTWLAMILGGAIIMLARRR